jgi:glutamate/tyrosine decarboxylase-like PLP-dependent enzyme
LDKGFEHLPAFETPVDADALRPILRELAERLRDNFPYPHPQYVGQMIKPPHPIARVAYALAQQFNPNNHALDGGRATSALEKEAVAELAAMFGWKGHLGHLTSGGTLGNLEALFVANKIHPGKTILASSQAHYTHSRLCGVLGIPFEMIPVDANGRMDLNALDMRLKAGGVGTVVATLGTTATGSVDPLPEILAQASAAGARIHVDAAYGGYFGLAAGLEAAARSAFDALASMDVASIVIDPHKHGLQPYGCGAVLFRDPSVGRFYFHDSPYTYFTSNELHLGEISLECSRPGASAAALWATQRLLPLVPGGAFAGELTAAHANARIFADRLRSDGRWIVPFAPDLDIVVWASGGSALRASAVSDRSRSLFRAARARDLHLALATLPVAWFPEIEDDGQGSVTVLRSCLMRSEHGAWFDRIFSLLDEAYAATL